MKNATAIWNSVLQMRYNSSHNFYITVWILLPRFTPGCFVCTLCKVYKYKVRLCKSSIIGAVNRGTKGICVACGSLKSVHW